MDRRRKLVTLAGKLTVLGTKLEDKRDTLKKLVRLGVPYDSPQMLTALREYQRTQDDWNALEREYLELRAELMGE